MAGIAVFPMPASSPAMSSLPLAVERDGPVIHAHTDLWLTLSTALTLLLSTTAERPVSTTPSVLNPQSISLNPLTHTNTNANKHSASTGILRSHIQHERGIPRQSLRRRSEPLFHFPPHLRSLPLRPFVCPASARVNSIEQLWLSPRLLDIPKHS